MEYGFQDWWNDLPHGNCKIRVHFGDGLCTEFTPRNCRRDETVRHLSIGMQSRQRSGTVRLLDSNTSLGLLAKHSSLHYLELMIRCEGSTLWPGLPLKQGQPRTCIENQTIYPYEHSDKESNKLVGKRQAEKRLKLSQDGRFQAVSVQEAVAFAMGTKRVNKRNASRVQEQMNTDFLQEKKSGKEEVSLYDFDSSQGSSRTGTPSTSSRSDDSSNAEFETGAHDDTEHVSNVKPNEVEEDFDTTDYKQEHGATVPKDDTAKHEWEETTKEESDPVKDKESSDESSSTSSSSSASTTSTPSDTMEKETVQKIHVDFNGIVGSQKSRQTEQIAHSSAIGDVEANEQTNTGEQDDDSTTSSSSQVNLPPPLAVIRRRCIFE